jgi:hypothetical protein
MHAGVVNIRAIAHFSSPSRPRSLSHTEQRLLLRSTPFIITLALKGVLLPPPPTASQQQKGENDICCRKEAICFWQTALME